VAPGTNAPVVLVVDDEPAIRLLCRVNLELDGYAVREAASLAAARAEIERGDVSVVLLDMHVGLEHGMSLLDELLERDPHIPVAVVTGSSDVDTEEYQRADAVLPKPFTIDQLCGTVRDLTTHAPR
jgi:DNA-binding NtrC family response regulator